MSIPEHRARTLLRIAASCIAAFLAGRILTVLIERMMPRSTVVPFGPMASSILIGLGGLCILVAFLPIAKPAAGAHARALGLSSLFCAAAYLGVALAPGHRESVKTFAVLWLLFAAQASVIASGNLVLSMILSFAPGLARQITILILSALISCLLWSKAPLEMTTEPLKGRLANSVLRISPPMAMMSAWYVESDAARESSEGNRFNIILGELSYKEWIGASNLSYPEILPGSELDSGRFSLGLTFTLLLWAIPLLVLGEWLIKRASKPGPIIA